MMRQYKKNDVDYNTFYSPWMKALAKNHTISELEHIAGFASNQAQKSAMAHLRAIDKTGSMTGNSAARAHARNTTSASGEKAMAARGAIEIHELFPEHAKYDQTR